ncbi:PLP-dependent transferase [Trichoderma camerunense]
MAPEASLAATTATRDDDLRSAWELDVSSVMPLIQDLASNFESRKNSLDEQPILKLTDSQHASLMGEYARPGAAHSVDHVLKEARDIFDYRIRMNHPRFYSFIPAAVSPYSWIGETVSSAFNSFAGSRLQSSGPSCIEQGLIQWMASKAGLPSTAGGLTVSGGSMANFTAMVLARDKHLPRDQRLNGVAYISDQTHSSVAKGLRILGFDATQIQIIPTDDRFRMKVRELDDQIQRDRNAGRYPFVVIASAGTTNTGSVDPLHEIVEICGREKLWVHVDGAYGASVLLSKERPNLLAGLGGVDSISWDAHKWLFQTYACGILLVRDKQHLIDSFATEAEYIRDAEEVDDVPNFWNLGLELTRPARAMKLWFTLRVLGVDMFGRAIDHGINMAEYAEKQIRLQPDWQITSPASLAAVTFRYAPPGKSEKELDALNVAISQKVIADNIAGILTTKLRGRIVLRICLLNPLTDEAMMKKVIDDLDKIARKLLPEIRVVNGLNLH